MLPKMDTEKRYRLISVSFLFTCLLTATACSGRAAPSPTQTSTPISLPSPTPTGLAEKTVTLIALPLVPTSTLACVNGLTFVEDLTIPDGEVVSAGSRLDKQWRVQNSGTCNWDQRYHMRLISGSQMEAAVEQALYPARAGTQATLEVVFTAPAEAGEYVSVWQAFDANGIGFGDTFFIKIIVQ